MTGIAVECKEEQTGVQMAESVGAFDEVVTSPQESDSVQRIR
jgi:hypothetical protein